MFNMLNIYVDGSDPMGLVLFIYPVLVFIASFVLQLVVHKKWVILLVNFVLWLILTFAIFNSSFLIWCFVYTFIALIGTLASDLLIYAKNKLITK